jgi:hypothetical protein
MAVEDAIWMLATDHWDRIWALLDGPARRELAEAVRRVVEFADDPDEQGLAALELGDLLVRILPPDDEVGRVADDTSVREAVVDVDVEAEWRRLIELLSLQTLNLDFDEVRVRLVAAPSLSAAQVRAAGENPERPFLIQLKAGDGTVRLPAFQFGPAGRALAVVLTVNQRLGAEEDPWGAADWWLGWNARLNAVPADLVGRADATLVAAAAALAGGDA